MYNQQPVGKYKLNVCTNLPCQLRDGGKALQHLEKKLGIATVSYTHLRAHETVLDLVCRLLLEKKKTEK